VKDSARIRSPVGATAYPPEHADVLLSSVAERVATSWDWSDNPADEELVREQVGRLAISERETHAVTCWLKVRTVEFLRTPSCAHLLRSPTRALVRHGHLTPSDAMAMVRDGG
jgi:hypothetical protein